MLKLFKTILIALAIVSAANASDKISKDEIKEIQGLVLFERAQIQVVDGYDMDSVYLLNVTIKGSNDKLFLTKDKKYLLTGDAINTQDGKKLDVPFDVSVMEGKEAFTFGKGKNEYILFTDPECPYCKKFESYFTQIEDKVKIKVFFYPLSYHSNAKDIALYVMSKKTYESKVDAMLNTTKDTQAFKDRKIDKAQLEQLEKDLAEQIKIGQTVVRGTPTLLDGKGNSISWVNMLASYGIKVQ